MKRSVDRMLTTHTGTEIAWAKLRSLVEGARLASCKLW